MNKKLAILVVVVYLTITGTVLLNYYPVTPLGLSLEPAAKYSTEYSDENAEDPQGVAVEEISYSSVSLAFSHNEHFYTSEIDVSIIASEPDAVIHFTLDGSEPTIDSDIFDDPITLSPKRNNDVNVITIKAAAALGNTISRPVVHTYFIGPAVSERFDTLIFSLSTDSDNLYDYDTGIFVVGVTRADYIRANPRARIDPPSPANFNRRGMEGERPVYAEVFTPDGTRVVAQAAGIRAHGGWSRAATQKSIRLIARSEYEPGVGKFHFDFFPGDTVRDGFYTPLAKYDQLVLRNGANDRDFGMLRNEVGYELARMTGLEVVSPVRPAAIYLNGEYYGFTWLQVRINAQYLEDIFAAPARHFQIVGMGEQWIDTEDEEEREAIEFIHGFYDKDFTNDAVLTEFEELVDLDQLLLYYALQTYLGNHDWPNNNLKLWRYTGPQIEGLAPELDGRWRYIVFDLDWILGLYEDKPNASRPTFQEMMNPRNDRYSYMLNALLVRPDIADNFAMIMCDLAANVITKQNVSRLIDELFGISENEIGFAFSARRYAHWVSFDSVRNNHTNMLTVAEGRSEYIFRSLLEHFEWEDDMFTIEVTGAEAYIGTQRGTSAEYFSHLTIPLRPYLPENTVFDRWEVNGAVFNTPEITVSIADAVDGVVSAELFTRATLPLLMFTEAYGSPARNGCALYNPGTEAVRTDGLYMTNDLSNPFRWALPDARIEPGETIEFAGRGSRDSGDTHKIKMGFNARHGQRLFLCDENGTVITSILVERED